MWHQIKKFTSRLALMALALFGCARVDAQQEIKGLNAPVVIFIHGRGQGESALDEVKSRFFGAFQSSQRKEFGMELLPNSALRFVWYADVIDTKSTTPPQSENCRFAADKQMDTSFRIDLRRSLIRIAQSLGLTDAALNAFAGDTHKYLTNPAIRCEADARVLQILSSSELRDRPKIIVAHSMGGIVAFSAIDKISGVAVGANRPKINQLITVGTQIGVTEVLQGLQGSFVKPPVPLPNIIPGWINFQNEGDLLAFTTDGQFEASVATRLPLDIPIKAAGDPHAIETYLGDSGVVKEIAKSWCEAFLGEPPSGCSLVKRDAPKTSDPAQVSEEKVTSAVAVLSEFLDVSPPVVKVVEKESDGTEIIRSGETYVLRIKPEQLAGYARSAAAPDFEIILRFFLAHEVAHVAQYMKPTSELDAQPSIVRECQADILAGMALINSQPLVGDVMWEFRKAAGVIAAASEGGSPLRWGLHSGAAPPSHPEATQRALCAIRGLAAGLNMIRMRQIALSEDRYNQSAKPELWQENPNEFGPRDEPWGWSLRNAKDITDQRAINKNWKVERAALINFIQAAEHGPSLLKSFTVLNTVFPLGQCSQVNAGGKVAVRCVASFLQMNRVAFESYENMLAVLTPILMSQGWKKGATMQKNEESIVSFHKGDAKAIARLDIVNSAVRMDFEAAQ